MSKKIISMFLVFVMVVGLFPTNVFASSGVSTLTTDIDGDKIVAGEWHEFNFTLNAKAEDAGKKVVGVSSFSNDEIIEKLEYWDATADDGDGAWFDMARDGDGNFGAAEGFEMPAIDYSASSKFRVMFKEAATPGEYSFNVQMRVVDGTTVTEEVLCQVTANFEVKAPTVGDDETDTSTLTTSIDGADVKAGEWFEFDFTLHAKAADAGKMVVGVSEFSDEEIIEALEYWETATSEWKNLLGGDGTFGPSTGFPMPNADVDATSKFRVKFKEDTKHDTYSFTVKMMIVENGEVTDEVLCETEAFFDVEELVKTSIYTDIDSAQIPVGEWHEFFFALNSGEKDAGKMVVGVSEFSDEDIIEALEYWEGDKTTGEWKNLLGGDGTFGPASGFPIPPFGTDAESKFRVKFKEDATPGEYSFTVELKLVADDSVLAETEAVFEVVNPALNVEHTSISTSIDGMTITAGEWTEFDFTMHAKAVDAGKMVIGTSQFANEEIIESLEYWETATGTWENLLGGDGTFGPASGFPIPNADMDVVSKFRVMFKEDTVPADYGFSAQLRLVADDSILCGTEATFSVVAPVVEEHSTLTNDIDGDEIEVNTWHEFSFTLSAKATDAGKKVVGVSQFSNSDIIEALEYWEGDDSTGEWKNLLIDGDGNFGAAEGFEMPAVDFSATSKFRVKFKADAAPGEYSFTAQMKVVDGTTVTDEVLCETTATFTVKDSHVHTIDTSKWEKDKDGHWHGVTCGHDVIGDYATHTSSDWIVDVEPGVGKKGSQHKECTVCGYVLETEEIPATSYIPVPTNVKVVIRGEDGELTVTGSLYAGVVSISLNSSQFKKLVGKNIDTGIIEFDVSDISRAVTGVELTKSNLKTILGYIEDYDVEGIQITMEDSQVRFDAEALEAIVDQAKSSEVEFSIDEISKSALTSKQKDAIKNMDILGIYRATITSGSREITDFEDGFATILIDDEVLGKKSFKGLVAYHVDTKGKLEEVDVDYHDFIEIVVPHFSEYVLGFNKEAANHECPKDKTCPLHKYKDLLTDGWYHDGVHYALEEGLMVGYSSNMFGPNDAITRGQLVTVLWRMENSPAVKYNMSFKDVKSDAYYANAVKWAQATGLVAGYSADSFGPDDAITREQMATIMQRYAQYKKFDVSVEKTTTLKNFKDANQVSDWALGAMKWAVEEGLIVGSANNLMPSNSTTRAQVSTILMRFCEAYCK